jgi:predicted MFS family arabinose efflux permease
MLMLAIGVIAVGMGLNSPSLSSMLSRLSDPNDQGGILGLASSLSSLGRVVGPVWGGFLFDHFGIAMPFLSGATIMLTAFAVSLVSLARSEV